MMILDASPEEIYVRSSHDPQCQLIDVRTPREFAALHIPGSINIPMVDMARRYREIDASRSAYIVCNSGFLAETAVLWLANHGDRKTLVLEGGLKAWKKAGFPLEGTGYHPLTVGRQLIFAATTLLLLGMGLSYFVDPAWIWLAVLVVIDMIQLGVTGSCVLGELLARAAWNRKWLRA